MKNTTYQSNTNDGEIIFSTYCKATKNISELIENLKKECEKLEVELENLKIFHQIEAEFDLLFPVKLFEADNIPNLFGTFWSVFMNAASSFQDIKIIDIDFPSIYLKHHKGPAFGGQGIREVLRKYQEPIKSKTVKNSLSKALKSYIEEVESLWADDALLVEDSFLTTDTDLIPFYDRVTRIIDKRRDFEREFKEKRIYSPNVSARTSEMYARAKFMREIGGRSITLDVLSVGFSGMQFLRSQNLELVLNTSISGAQLKNSSLQLPAFIRICRLIGIDRIKLKMDLKRDMKKMIRNIGDKKWDDYKSMMIEFNN